MDLGKIQSTDRSVTLMHPLTGEPTGLVFHLRSPDSFEVKRVQREWQDRMLSPKRRGKKISAVEMEAFQDNRIVAQVSNWEFTDEGTNFDGDQPEYSEDTLRKWLKKFSWIRQFLVDETEDLTAFLTGQESN